MSRNSSSTPLHDRSISKHHIKEHESRKMLFQFGYVVKGTKRRCVESEGQNARVLLANQTELERYTKAHCAESKEINAI